MVAERSMMANIRDTAGDVLDERESRALLAYLKEVEGWPIATFDGLNPMQLRPLAFFFRAGWYAGKGD